MTRPRASDRTRSDTALDQSTAGQEQAELKKNPATGNSQVQPRARRSCSRLRHRDAADGMGQGHRREARRAAAHRAVVAGNIVSRATQLQQSAQQSALTFVIITVVVLLVVLLGRPRWSPGRWCCRCAGCGRARLTSPRCSCPSGSGCSRTTRSPPRRMEVAPINVTSQDEIGQVARAFDQVHSEAVRLAGEQALLRSSFNAMFVNLSRRSQTLIERLARMIDNLEQNEDDPDRLGSLFSMDHLVTRMRRNSENLLLLAGHENPRKWSESVPLADIARAATSEIEQYNRVTLNIPPGVSVVGQAVSDVVHLLAELVENATIFSPKDTQVLVAHAGADQRRRAHRDRRQGHRRLRGPADRHELAARQPADDRRVRLPAHGPVRRRAAGRAAPGQGPAAARAARRDCRPWSGCRTASSSGRAGSARARAAGRRSRSARGRACGGGSPPPSPRAGQASLGDGYSTGQASPATATRRTAAGNGYSNGRAGTRRWRAARRRAGSAAGRTAPAVQRRRPGRPGRRLRTGLGPGRRPGRCLQRARHYDDQTAAGLPVRVPRANMPPGASGGGPADGQAGPPRAAGPRRRAGKGPGSANSGHTLPRRSPDQARSRLAGFQRGTRRAEGQGGSGGQAPRAGEGSWS